MFLCLVDWMCISQLSLQETIPVDEVSEKPIPIRMEAQVVKFIFESIKAKVGRTYVTACQEPPPGRDIFHLYVIHFMYNQSGRRAQSIDYDKFIFWGGHPYR